MNKTLGILFYVKKAKMDDSGKAPIYVRITVDGIRSELSIKRTIELERWSGEAVKVKGNNEEAKSINSYIDTVRMKIYEHQKKLMDYNKTVTAEAIKNSILGVEEKQRTLVAIFQYHNKQVKALVGKEFAAGTLERYETVLKLLQQFLQHQYKVKDMAITQVNHKFITDFEYFLKTERNNAHNTAIKYIKNFKKIVRISLANGWIDKDPFINFKATIKEVERTLSQLRKARQADENRIRGVISRLLPNGKSGFIKAFDGKSYYFAMRDLRDGSGGMPAEGQPVNFVVVDSFDKSKNKATVKASDIRNEQ